MAEKAKKTKCMTCPQWMLVISLLLNLRLDQYLVTWFTQLFARIVQGKYPQEVLAGMAPEELTAIQETVVNLEAIGNLGIRFLIPAIALILALKVRKDKDLKPFAYLSVFISILGLLNTLFLLIGFLMNK